jgi:hypothetical protein
LRSRVRLRRLGGLDLFEVLTFGLGLLGAPGPILVLGGHCHVAPIPPSLLGLGRDHDTAGDDQFDALLDRDVETVDIALRNEQQKSGGRVGGGRHKDVIDRLRCKLLHLAFGLTGNEADRPGSAAGVFDQHHLAKGRGVTRQHRLQHLARPAIDRTYDRYLAQEPLAELDDDPPQVARGHEADHRQADDEDDDAEPRHGEGQIVLGVPLRRHQGAEAVIDEGDHLQRQPNRNADRRRHQYASDEIVPKACHQADASALSETLALQSGRLLPLGAPPGVIPGPGHRSLVCLFPLCASSGFRG